MQADELADRMTELALNPAPILLVHRAPADGPGHRARGDGPGSRSTTSSTGTTSGTGSGRSATRELLSRIDAGLAASQALIADGHHRYAAYLRMQRRSPGGPTDRGLAMLVDQEDTPLFLGPIHRILTGVGLEDLAAAAEVVGAGFDLVERAAAVHALGPAILAATDGRGWATVKLDVPADRAAVEVLHEDLRARAAPRAAADRVPPLASRRPCDHLRRDSVAVLMPAPDVDLVLQIAARRPAAAGEGHLLPAEAQRRRAHPLPARRMSRPRLSLHLDPGRRRSARRGRTGGAARRSPRPRRRRTSPDLTAEPARSRPRTRAQSTR